MDQPDNQSSSKLSCLLVAACVLLAICAGLLLKVASDTHAIRQQDERAGQVEEAAYRRTLADIKRDQAQRTLMVWEMKGFEEGRPTVEALRERCDINADVLSDDALEQMIQSVWDSWQLTH